VDEKRLAAQVEPAEVMPFDDADFEKYPSLAKGYIGPGVLGEKNTSEIRYLLDPRVGIGTAWATGADRTGFHVINLVHGRDFTADGTIQAAEVRDGDPAPDGSGALSSARGIEMGHVFQLGRKYAEALGLTVLNQDGKQVTVTMGSYGIGVTRAVAAIAESTHDELGLCWPREVAPADVHLVIAAKPGGEEWATAEKLAADAESRGVRVLLDDRDSVSPGVKFKDAELLGVPTIVVVGRRLADGLVEVRDRKSGERADVPVGEAVDRLTELTS
jgi:prolyl-tRNA synthetase